ncbi:hypothetical protein FSP39_017957 [Pinctada imbricata]|uniref:Uncharacterized protein n=1 Tax=Pinctada imbricata TaxID=66713 RepID=A0AA88Y4G7_PINIB|nr:hypothetical protein FSP39_017957 [Pinctada imbricata]
MEAQGKMSTGNQVLASLKNVRAQRLLDRELKHIENLWNVELKHITLEKLEATREYTKLEDDRRNAEYLMEHTLQNKKDDKRRIESIKEYSKLSLEKRKQKKEHKYIMEKYDFKAHENDKMHVQLEEVDKPVYIMKENGLVRSFPPIPPKPRLTRSNSTVGDLIKAKSSTEDNVPSSDFGLFIQRETKTKPKHLTLPDIREYDSNGKIRKRDISFTAIPDIDEMPEMPSKKKFIRRRIASITNLANEPRRHTIL